MTDPVAAGVISSPIKDFGPAMKGMVIGGLAQPQGEQSRF